MTKAVVCEAWSAHLTRTIVSHDLLKGFHVSDLHMCTHSDAHAHTHTHTHTHLPLVPSEDFSPWCKGVAHGWTKPLNHLRVPADVEDILVEGNVVGGPVPLPQDG